MSLTAGTRLGPYEVAGAIGAGGMGEVYRARDSKLGRDVALKILPELFAADPDRLARFEREAQVLAALNHPNIAAIYGLEESGGVRALVLELVEGPTLADRIARGPVPADEALVIAVQIAHALEAAHEKGIVHRDLKPGNVALTANGRVKVLDFGLAKALEGNSSPDLSNSPTLAFQPTQAGVILGTAAYMAPEQARGKSVDKRADLWALGCVIFEMLTGRHAFEGETLSDIVAAVMKSEPAWEALPPDTPPAIRSLLRRLLQKEAGQRQRDAGDAAIEIQEALAHPASVHDTPGGRRRARWETILPWVATTLALLLAALAFQWGSGRVVPTKRPAVRLELNLPAGVEMNAGYSPSIAASPDGSRVAFVGTAGGLRQLYVRRLDQFDSIALHGTETAQTCFFSPDGGSLGFITGDRTLKRISLADGLVVILARHIDQGGGMTWGADDRITFGRNGALWQVAGTGGAATQISRLDAARHELSHGWPSSIGGGKSILFASIVGSRRDSSRIEVLSVATGQRRVVVEAGTLPLYDSNGHLIFFRESAIVAARFDADRLEVQGPPVRVVEDLAVDFNGAPLAAISSSGSLIYPSSGTESSRLVWVSRQGVEQSLTDSTRLFQSPRLAPDGRRIAVQIAGDLWIEEMARATFTRLTSDATSGNSFPVWTNDGSRVVFRTITGMRWIDVDGSGRSAAIAGSDSVGDIPSSISPDGDTLAFIRQTTEDTSGDVYVASLRGEWKARPVVTTPAYDGGPQFSPDGHWMAYVSGESGQFQVYVRPYPGPDWRRQVSAQGGTHPRWNANGKELFYRGANKMMAVDVSSTGGDIQLSSPRVLFEQRYAFGSAQSIANYDVSADGQRFLMVKNDSAGGRLNVVLNWFEELKERLAAK